MPVSSSQRLSRWKKLLKAATAGSATCRFALGGHPGLDLADCKSTNFHLLRLNDSPVFQTQATVRHAGWLAVQRGGLVVGGFLYAVLVPRLLGPADYGRLALVTTLAAWFVLLSALGLLQAIGRYAPQFVLQGDTEGLRWFFGRLLAVRLVSGALAAGLFLLFTLLWLRDLDPLLLALVAGVVFVQAAGNLFYAFFLGLNRAARWGAGEIVGQWVSLALLPPGFLLGGLRGAGLALLLTELVVLGLGLWWVRPYLAWSHVRLDLRRLAPYLRFGLVFFGSNLLTATFHRSGEALVRAVAGDYAQVGYFGLAQNVYLTAALAVPQFTLAFAPLLTALRTQGQVEAMRRWIERLLAWLAVGGVLVAFSALLVGDDLVPLVFGPAYRPVAANLVPLTLALLPLALSSVANLLALIHDRPGLALQSAGVLLVAFWALGLPLVAAWGSLGGCLAALGASTLYAGAFTWRVRRVTRYSLRPWALAILPGVPFLPLVVLRSSGPVNLALYGAFVIGYGGLLLWRQVITIDELIAVWQAMRRIP